MIAAGSGAHVLRSRPEEPVDFAVPVDLVEPLAEDMLVVKTPTRKAVKK